MVLQQIRSVLLFCGCALLGMSVGAALALLVAYLMGNITEIHSTATFVQQVSKKANGWYIFITVQAVSHLFSYLVPALVYWYYVERARWRDFQKRSLGTVAVGWAGVLPVVTLLPFNELLIHWNQKIELPKAFWTVEKWMREKEQAGNLLTNQITAFVSVDQLFIALLVVGFIAAIGEEVFFRGVIQNKLIAWTRNRHIGVWLAAVLFSAAHLQFFGFFPRLLLGVLFGYLYVWSGNLWLPVLAHFVNNGLVVLMTYFWPQSANLTSGIAVESHPWIWGISSVVVSAILLVYFQKTNQRFIPKSA